MSVKSDEELEGLRKIGRIVALTVREMFKAIRIGMTTAELDHIGKTILDGFGAKSAPKLCYGFSGSTMISINEEVAHTIPGQRQIRSGDLVNIDVSAELNGYFADTGFTMPMTDAPKVAFDLCAASQEALNESLRVAKAGRRIADIESAIRGVARKRGFSVIQNLTGHGVGRHIHEEPDSIPAFDNGRDKRRLKKGTVLTIEPFLSTGPRQTYMSRDGWTLVTPNGNFTAQFEHSIVITESEPIILTAA